jgi:type IV pilus assembly protein PilF
MNVRRLLGGWLLITGLVTVTGCVTEGVTSHQPADRTKQLQTLVDLGVGYLQNGEYARAKEHLNKALELDSRSALAHNTLALVFQAEQEFVAAEEHFRAAIKNDPKFTRSHNNYGAFLFDRKRYDEAIQHLKIASEDRYYAGRAAVFENLGVCYARQGDAKDAEDSFVRSVALNPSQARALIELSEIRFGQQRFVESRELYQRFLALSQHSSRSLLLCVRLARVFDNSNDAASCAIALRNIFPSSEEFKQYQQMVGQ